jgi:(p)ppGpp synthase/HD superfamily hydrolase
VFEIFNALFRLNAGFSSFLSMVEVDFPRENGGFRLIQEIYDLVTCEFAEKRRETGELYLRHLESTALITGIVLRQKGISNLHGIAGGLLHDLTEEKPAKWPIERIRRQFCRELAEIVKWLTEPELELFGGDKTLREAAYRKQTASAPFIPRVVKRSDFLHNLMTLWGKSVERQRRKIKLAREFYMPLAAEDQILELELKFVLPWAEAHCNTRSAVEFFGSGFR